MFLFLIKNTFSQQTKVALEEAKYSKQTTKLF